MDKKKHFNLLFIFLSLSFRGHPGNVWSTLPGLSIVGKPRQAMRRKLRHANNSLWAPRPIAISRSAYEIPSPPGIVFLQQGLLLWSELSIIHYPLSIKKARIA